VTTKQLTITPKTVLAAIALFVLAVRLCTLPFPDLVDTTEGRYAGVAQIMLQRDDWVTPWIHYEGINQPYLGKPPLHFWLIQTSFLLFGQNNFAARLPGVISATGIGAVLGFGALALFGWEVAVVSVAVFASSCMTFFLSGATLLDVTLTLGITISLVSLLLVERSRLAGYLFFVGLAIGVMTKGPLAGILTGVVIVPWAFAHRFLAKSWPRHFARLPWVAGSIVFFALVLPWYLWAESRNPGFLEYFLLNENFGRYFKKNYVDEYGSGHRQPFGASFLMMMLAVFPWSFLLLGLTIPHIKRIFSKRFLELLAKDPTLLFVLSWTLSCPVLLLGAKQYTATYLMPSVPGFALLVGVLWHRYRNEGIVSDDTLRRLLTFGTGFIVLAWIVISITSLWFMPNMAFVVASLGLAVWVALGFGYFVRSPRQSGQCFGILILLALISTLTYGASALCFDNHLSTNRSSRRVLSVAHSIAAPDKPLRIGFAYYYPFSAWFYAPQTVGSQATLLELEEGNLGSAQADLLIVRKRNFERLKKELPNAQEVASVGQWRIVKP